MENIIKWGLLSTARINRSVIPGIRAAKRSELVAIGSRNVEKGRDFAQKFAIPRSHGSYEDLLADPQVDVVYIPLPNHLHAEWAIKAVQAGKHVLLEKPITLSLAEMKSIQDAAQKTGRIVMEAFMYRHHPQTLKVQELLKSGAVGKILFIRGVFTFLLDRPDDIRWVAEYGGGSLWDIGCYPVTYSNMAAGGAPVRVHGSQVLAKSGVDLTFNGQMEYLNGIQAQFYCSFGLDYKAEMEIRGTKGSIFVRDPFKPHDPDVPLILRQENREERFFFPEMELYLGEVENLENAILDGKPQRLSLEESRQNLATLLALLESARTGSMMSV